MTKVHIPGRDHRDKSAPKPRPLILQHSSSNKIPLQPMLYGSRSNEKPNSFSWTKVLDNSLLDLHARFGSNWQLILQMLPPFALKNRARITVEMVKKRYKDLQSRRIAKQVIELNYLQSKENMIKRLNMRPVSMRFIDANNENIMPSPVDSTVIKTEQISSLIKKEPIQTVTDNSCDLVNESEPQYCQETLSNIQSNVPSLVDEDFYVQTPTKAIGESEKLTFHLMPQNNCSEIFEPKTLLSWSSWSRTMRHPSLVKRVDASTLKKNINCDEPPKKKLKNIVLRKSTPGIIESRLINSNIIKRSSSSDELGEDTSIDDTSSTKSTLSSLKTLQTWENPDMIALNTAKATVMNRLMVQEKEREQRQRFEARQAKRQIIATTSQAMAPGENAIPRLPVPIGSQPHFSIRRIIQTGHDQVAFGGDENTMKLEEMARLLITSDYFNKKMPQSSEDIKQPPIRKNPERPNAKKPLKLDS